MSDSGNSDRRRREYFVAFLEQFANGDVAQQQWLELVVNHYRDETLERVRRDCVRLRMGNESMEWSIEERERIQSLIRDLRTESD